MNATSRLFAVTAAAPLLLGLAACRPAPEPAAPAATADAPARSAEVVLLDDTARQRAGLVVTDARTVERADAIDAPGIVALNEARTARIGSLAEGIVVDLRAQVGDRVRPQQVLATMHSHIVYDAWAGYRKAKADERRLQTELRYATDAQARAERLYAAKAVSLQELQRAEANRASAEESLDMGRTEVRRSEEELEHLGITNGEDPSGESGEQIPVRAPFAGVVLERLVTQGTTVTPGTALFVVSDLATVWVLAELDEAHVSGAQVGRPVNVRVAAYPSEVFTGRVTYVGETVNPKTRRITVRCEVPNPEGRLKPEMYATVEIGEAQGRPVVVVPADALQVINNQPAVFVAESDTQFRLRPVQPGPTRDGLVEVRRGLQAGDRVVTSGSFILKSELLKTSDSGE
ncbi:MAG: efflux RND transporter periplasmic adaptor subunit [Acidobacteria bacterium]|nr:efflux RND transporter periplasmic adaptor subunit [Acidobacteriota bacterium]